MIGREGWMISKEDNETLVRRFFEEVLVKDADRLDDYLTADYVDHSRIGDRRHLEKVVADHLAAYPQAECHIDEMFASEDKVAVHARFTFQRAGGDESKLLRVTAIFRLSGGKIAEAWANSDSFF
jgi:predicted SnoaL-like aldol condensation-catalyzing enzyme